jgi:hypothetical protein
MRIHEIINESREENFKRWFGNSKVVDGAGRPLVVYHGTAIPKNTFGRDGGAAGVGAYFTTNLVDAERYADNDASVDGDDPIVMGVYLSIKNPKIMNSDESFGITSGQRDALEAEGFDGIYNPEVGEYIAFRPTQIKSATGNNGEFNPNNPDITKEY